MPDKPSLLLCLQLVSLFPQPTLPKLPACHAEVTYSIAPSPNLRTQSHLQHSCSNTKPAHGEVQRAETQSLAVLAKSGAFDKRCLEKSRRYKGPGQNCVANIHSTNDSAISQWPSTKQLGWRYPEAHVKVGFGPMHAFAAWLCDQIWTFGPTIIAYFSTYQPPTFPGCNRTRFTADVNQHTSSKTSRAEVPCTTHLSSGRVQRSYYFVKY